MDGQLIDALSQRVEQLERQNRRMRSVGLALGAALAALALMGQTALPGAVRTTRLDLVDATGTTRATLAVTYPDNVTRTGPNLSMGTPHFTLYGRDGSFGASIALSEADGENGELTLVGQKGTVHLGTGATGPAQVNVLGTVAGGQVRLLAQTDGTASLGLDTATTFGAIEIGASPGTGPHIHLKDGQQGVWSAP